MPPTPHEPPYVADRRLYLDSGGRVVEATDPARVTLLVTAGGSLPAAQARALGLLDEPDPAGAPQAVDPAAERDPSPKARELPAAGGPENPPADPEPGDTDAVEPAKGRGKGKGRGKS